MNEPNISIISKLQVNGSLNKNDESKAEIKFGQCIYVVAIVGEERFPICTQTDKGHKNGRDIWENRQRKKKVVSTEMKGPHAVNIETTSTTIFC